MILIAESGSTKSEWAALSDAGVRSIFTQGISPYFLNDAQIADLLRQELLPSIPDPDQVSGVYYYGTGCTAAGTIAVLDRALRSVFPRATMHITYDLVAAAHALCGHDAGVACILGTGSNSCYYTGSEIGRNSPGIGYLLGDEGSGAYLGKLLIRDYLYGRLDQALASLFEEEFSTDPDSLLEKVYAAALPNRYLASYSMFFSRHRGHPYLEGLLQQGLDDFFTNHILSYTQCRSVPVHFTGSVAWGYRDVLERLCALHGLMPGKIIKEPMNGLLEYYRRGGVAGL